MLTINLPIALAGLVVTLIALWQLYGRYVLPELRPHFWPALCAKILGGWALGLLYSRFYTSGDTWAMYQDSQMLVEQLGFGKDYFRYIFSIYEVPDALLAQTQAPGHKAFWMSLLVGIVGVFSAQNYWLISLYFSIFSFLGIWAMAQALRHYLSIPRRILAVCWLYWPSLLVWGSGLLKESLMMGSIGWLIALSLHFHLGKSSLRQKFIAAIWASCCAYLLLQVKFYYFAPLLICLGGLWALWLTKKLWKQHKVPTTFALASLMIGLVFIGEQAYPTLSLKHFPEQIIENQQHIYRLSSKTSSIIAYEGIEANWASIMSFVPQAFIEGSFRPYIWEDGHWLKKLAGFEGLALAIAVLWAASAGIHPRKRLSMRSEERRVGKD